MAATPSGSKRRWGKLAYFASAIAASGRIRNVTHEITLDGVTTKTMAAQVIVANFGRMMAGLAPRRPVLPDDGLLEVIVVRASGRFAALPAAWEALRQTELGHSSGGHVFRAQAQGGPDRDSSAAPGGDRRHGGRRVSDRGAHRAGRAHGAGTGSVTGRARVTVAAGWRRR